MIRRWGPVWAPAYALLSTLMLVAAVLAFLRDGGDWQGWLFFVMYAVVGAGIAWNCRREGVLVDGGGMTLTSILRREVLPWSQVRSVDTGEGTGASATWQVRLTDGRVLDTRIKARVGALAEAVERHRP